MAAVESPTMPYQKHDTYSHLRDTTAGDLRMLTEAVKENTNAVKDLQSAVRQQGRDIQQLKNEVRDQLRDDIERIEGYMPEVIESVLRNVLDKPR